MTSAVLEHVNVTVSNPANTAEFLCKIFDWRIRWRGPSKSGGTTFHVGNRSSYIAVYSHGAKHKPDGSTGSYINGLNHIALVVDDLEKIERRVVAEGFEPHNHGDYKPGRRFYFHDNDGIEFEIVTYQSGFWSAMREIAEAGIARR